MNSVPATDGHGVVPDGTLVPARLAYVALFVAVGASAPFLPVYYDSLGIDVRLIPLLAALMAGAGLFGSPLWGATALSLVLAVSVFRWG